MFPHFHSDSSQSPNIVTFSKRIFIISVLSLVLGGVAITAILRGFDGRIDIKLGLEGGQVVIDGRKSALPSPITDNSSNTK